MVLSGASVVVGLAVVVSVDVGSNDVKEEEVELKVELAVVRLGVLVKLEISDVVDNVKAGSEVVELLELEGRVVLELNGTVLDSVEVFPGSELVDEELLPGLDEVGSEEGAVVEESEAGREEGEGVGVGLDVVTD